MAAWNDIRMRLQARFHGQGGLTIVELMVSLTVAMFIVLAATAMLISAKSTYIAHIDNAEMQETGRFALEVISRSIRQSAYANWDQSEGPIIDTHGVAVPMIGMDGKSLKSRTRAIDSPTSKSVNGSDVLAVRFHGAGTGENGDGTMLNCAGFPVGAPEGGEASDEDRDWSIFYVAEDSTGEPELYCKYFGTESWTSQAIARGVESFQVLYGLDMDHDGLPNKFLTATALGTLDKESLLRTDGPSPQGDGKGRQSLWAGVVAVKFALLLRGPRTASAERRALMEYDLFGKEYSDMNAVSDTGTRIRERELPKAVRWRERKLFLASVQLRAVPMGKAR